MCWMSNKLKIKTAKKDIAVWKVVLYDIRRGFYVSPIANYRYVLGVINNVKMIFKVNNDLIGGYDGFHSFSNKVYYRYFDGNVDIFKKCIFTMDKYVFSICYKHGFDFAIAKCRLPSGTKYAINKSGEIISSNIIIDEFINLQP